MAKRTANAETFTNQTPQRSDPAPTTKRQLARFRALSILDDFSHQCFSSEFELIPAHRENWLDQLENDNIDFFFAESAWRGNGGTWNYSMSKFAGKFGKPLSDLIRACNRKNIPTVFWNKEDPLNYDTFISVALLFDHIFTTDENMVERYRKDAGHDRVYVLPFAANGNVHTPIMSGMRNGRIAFAGSWHGRKYPIRAERLDMLFKHPHREGLLDIFDRHSSAPSVEDGLKYPDKYQDAVLPAVPYEKIADSVYKKYSVALNVNSVETSTSMLARRIYELCGCGTPILSSPARSLEGELREIVPVARSAQEAEQLTKRLLTDEVYSMRLAARGVRFVHSRNTYSHRAHKILKVALGTSSSDEHTRFSVTAICVSKRPWYAEAVARMLKSQENIDLSVVYVAHGVEANENEVTQAFQGFEKFKFLRIAEEDTVLADGLNAALEVCDTDIVAKIDDDDHYGPHYLYDSCLALRYSKADIVGKASFFFHVESTNDFGIRFPGKHYRYFKRVQGGTLVWNQHKTLGIQFTPVRQGTDSLFIRDILDRGGKVFSSDPFNFVHVRHSSANNHTWSIADNDFLRPTKILAKGLQLDLAFA